MARVLLVDFDGGGNLPPELGVLEELVRRGHTAHVLADPTIEVNARGVGAGFSPWQRPRHFDSIDEQTAGIRDLERMQPLARARFARDEILCGPAPLYADDVVETAAGFRPDVVLVGWALVGGVIGALATGVPVAALIPNAYNRPSAPLPRLGTGWELPRGRAGRWRDAALAAAVRRLQRSGLAPVNAALARHGLEPTDDMFSLVDRCERVLVLTSPRSTCRSRTCPRTSATSVRSWRTQQRSPAAPSGDRRERVPSSSSA